MKKLVLLITLSVVPSLTFANRLADPKYKKHCTDMPKEKCKRQLESAKRINCITQSEYVYSLKQGENNDGAVIVPLCDIADSDFVGWCFCSCFVKGTRLWVEDVRSKERVWLEVEKIVANHSDYRLVVPAKNATRTNMHYGTVAIDFWSSGLEKTPLRSIEVEDGTVLTVTGNHLVMLGNGKLAEGSAIKVGDHLVKKDGKSTRVVAVKDVFTSDEVFNVLLEGEDTNAHLIFAEGLTVGDALWENSSEEEVAEVQFPD